MAADDLVLICDADEIVNPEAIGRITDRVSYGVAALEMWLYPHDTSWRCVKPWMQAKAARPHQLQPDLRGMWAMKRVQRAGWHLTTSDDTKLSAFAHAECDTVEHRAHVQRCRDNLTDLEARPLIHDPLPPGVIT
jgi:hypothetical protein